MNQNIDELDILTTSVGRSLLEQTYTSLFRHLDFDGKINIGVVVDPSYGVSAEEKTSTKCYIDSLQQKDERISSVSCREFSSNVGLQRALITLFTMARTRHCLYIEDDWVCLGNIDVSSLVEAMAELRAGMIAFSSPTVAANGTFERENEAVPHRSGSLDLFRLVNPSWAADYRPLHPHLHDARIWPTMFTQALMEDDNPYRCPDERVRDWIRMKQPSDPCPTYWTREILFEDIGRSWLAEHSTAKDIAPSRRVAVEPHAPGAQAKFGRSLNYYKRAISVIPGETQTFMKRRLNFPERDFPIYADSGHGPYVWDADGNGYLDMICGLGALSLGHCHPAVLGAMEGQSPKGVLHSLPTLVEIEAAESLARVFPGTPKVRFFKTGSDATASAVRLARATTNKDFFISCGYHGSHDMFMVNTPGVPAQMSKFTATVDPFATQGELALESLLESHGDQLAAFILAAPYHRELSAHRLQSIQQQVHRTGALFIMDEIVTGFRFPGGSASAYFELNPDIVCWGKSLAAGAPIAAITMKPELADTMASLHVSTTYGGDTISLAICRSVLNYTVGSDYSTRMWNIGIKFKKAINLHSNRLGLGDVVSGYPSLPYFLFSPDRVKHVEKMRVLQSAAARHGVLMREDLNFFNDGFDERILEQAINRVCSALEEVPPT